MNQQIRATAAIPVEELCHDAIVLLQHLIAAPSFSGAEQATAQILHHFMMRHDIYPLQSGNNVWARNKHFDPSKPTILLNSHHDTVKANRGYTRAPFMPSVEDGKLYGLGSNDAGGCLVALLAAFRYFHEAEGLACNLVFTASAEEEISGANGISALLPELGDIDCAIVGEPTSLEMAIAEKGLLVLDCTANGVSGHVARDEGENAIYKALPDIEWFRNYRFPRTSGLLGECKMTVALINGGLQHNVVPATCTFTVDVRVNDCYAHEEILDIVRDHIACDVEPRSMRLRATSIDGGHRLVLAGKALGKQCYGSPTLSDKALMPFPALKIGPGDSARSHMADEFIYLSEIEDGIATYIALLKQIL